MIVIIFLLIFLDVIIDNDVILITDMKYIISVFIITWEYPVNMKEKRLTNL